MQRGMDSYLEDRNISTPESDIVIALGVNGFVSELDGELVCCKSWTFRDEKGYRLTEGVRGMKFKDLASETEMTPTSLSSMMKKLEKKNYLFRMSAYTSRHLMGNLLFKEAVLTRQGTQLYGGITSFLSGFNIK